MTPPPQNPFPWFKSLVWVWLLLYNFFLASSSSELKSTFVVKVVFHEEVYRFQFTKRLKGEELLKAATPVTYPPLNLYTLRRKCMETVLLEEVESFRDSYHLIYVDEEGDEVVITGDLDLLEAYEFFTDSGKLLRVKLQERTVWKKVTIPTMRAPTHQVQQPTGTETHAQQGQGAATTEKAFNHADPATIPTAAAAGDHSLQQKPSYQGMTHASLQRSKHLETLKRQQISAPPGATSNPRLIFTCTTYFSYPGRWQKFVTFMDSLVKHETLNVITQLVDEFIVLNEYSARDLSPLEQGSAPRDYTKQLKEKYPFVNFVQKTSEQPGQPRSLNIILDYLKVRNATFWVHWEESWEVTSPFLRNALAVMTMDPSVDQMEFTHNWIEGGLDIDLHSTGRAIDNVLDVSPDFAGMIVGQESGEDVVLVDYNNQITYVTFLDDPLNPSDKPDCYTDDNLFQKHRIWPLFSLRPGIDRVTTILSTGYFDEDVQLWPWRFELIYSARWYCLERAKKAVLLPKGVARRQPKHLSTYIAPSEYEYLVLGRAVDQKELQADNKRWLDFKRGLLTSQEYHVEPSEPISDQSVKTKSKETSPKGVKRTTVKEEL